MKNNLLVFLAILALSFRPDETSTAFEKDVVETKAGKLTIHFIGHGSLMAEIGGKIIHIDPCGRYAKYDSLPKADLIFITHHHSDHLDSAAIAGIYKSTTQIILPAVSFEKLKKGTIMKNGEKKTMDGIEAEAIPAYNTTAGKEKFHPKGRDNGYVLTIGGKRIYISGDTENTPEMEALKKIDIAFLAMNQPYTMTPEQVAAAANKFNPAVLYPYHYGESDIGALKKLMAGNKKVEVRIRKLK